MFKKLKNQLEQNIGASLTATVASAQGRALGTSQASVKPSTSTQSIASNATDGTNVNPSQFASKQSTDTAAPQHATMTSASSTIIPIQQSNNNEDDPYAEPNLISITPPTLPSITDKRNNTTADMLDPLGVTSNIGNEKPSMLLLLQNQLAAKDKQIQSMEVNLIRIQSDFRDKLLAEEREKQSWKIAASSVQPKPPPAAALTAELQTLRIQVETLTNTNRAIDAERIALQVEKEKFTTQLATKDDLYESAQSDIERLRMDLIATREQLSSLAADTDIYNTPSIAENVADNALQIEQHANLKAEHEKLLDEQRARDEILQQIERELHTLRTEAEKVNAEMLERDATLASMQQNHETLQAKLKSAEQNLEGATLYYTELEAELQKKRAELAETAEQLDLLQKFKQVAQTAQDENSALLKELETVNAELQEAKEAAAATAASSPRSPSPVPPPQSPTRKNSQQQQTSTSADMEQLRLLKQALVQLFPVHPAIVAVAASSTANDSSASFVDVETAARNNHAYVDAVVTSVNELHDAKHALGAQVERLIGDVRAARLKLSEQEAQIEEQTSALLVAGKERKAASERAAEHELQISSLKQQQQNFLPQEKINNNSDAECKQLRSNFAQISKLCRQNRSEFDEKISTLRTNLLDERQHAVQDVLKFRASFAQIFTTLQDKFTQQELLRQQQQSAEMDETHQLTSELEEKISILQQQLEHLQNDNQNEQKRLQTLLQAEHQKTQAAAVENLRNELNQRHARLEQEHERVTLELEQTTLQLDAERTVSEEREQQILQFRQNYAEIDAERNALVSQLADLKRNSAQIAGERDSFAEQVEFLKQDVSAVIDTKAALEKQLAQLTEDAAVNEQEKKQISLQAEQLRIELKKLRDQLAQQENDNKKSASEIKRLEDAVRAVDAVAANQKNLCEQFRTDIDRLEQQLKLKQRDYDAQLQLAQALQAERNAKQTELDGVQAEHRHTLDSIQTLTRDLSNVRADAEIGRENTARLVREKDEQIRQLEQRMQSSSQEANRTVQLRAERDDALRRIEDLRAAEEARVDAARQAVLQRMSVETQVYEYELLDASSNGAEPSTAVNRQTRQQLIDALQAAHQDIEKKSKALKKQQQSMNELKKLVRDVRSSGGAGGGNVNNSRSLYAGGSMVASASFSTREQDADNISLGSNAESTSTAAGSGWMNNFHNNNDSNSSTVRKATSYNDIPSSSKQATTANAFSSVAGGGGDDPHQTNPRSTNNNVDMNTPLLIMGGRNQQQQYARGAGDAAAVVAGSSFMPEHYSSSTSPLPPPATLPTQQQSAATSTSTAVYKADINFEYMKNVLLKFLGSTHDEAVHLVKPVVTLLHLTPEEEAWLNQVVAWRESWFGTLTAAKPAKTPGINSSNHSSSSRSNNDNSSSHVRNSVSSTTMRAVPGSAAAASSNRSNLRRP